MSESKLPLEGLKVIVIGAGFGGLAASIELASRGASVRIFEAYSEATKAHGDVIQIPANATRLIAKWGDVLNRVVEASSNPDTMTVMKKDGKVVLNQQLHKEFDGFENMYGHRGKIQQAFNDYAISLGVKIEFRAKVTEVFENASSAGVYVDGTKYEADFVIAGDGVHSKTRSYVVGKADRPKKSGFAVYRSWFPLQLLADNPLTKEIAESKEPNFCIWIAEDTHAILTTNIRLQSATCFVTHKDTSDITEDWNLKGDVNDMLTCVQDWDPQLRHIISKIPPECLIDYKLLWRDPVPQWVSENGRVCLIGDAAHPHLSTSGTGAAQAIEDGATIGKLLEKAGTDDIPLVLKCFQKLRYERTSLTQRMGWETRHAWHQTDWDMVASNPDFLKLPQPEWLLGSNATTYAEENFEAVKAHIERGGPFQSTNIPSGHVHEDWTIEMMLAHEGKKAEADLYQTRD